MRGLMPWQIRIKTHAIFEMGTDKSNDGKKNDKKKSEVIIRASLSPFIAETEKMAID